MKIKKISLLMFSLVLSFNVFSCTRSDVFDPYTGNQNSISGGVTSEQKAYASPTPYAQGQTATDLSSLRAGVLPQTSFTEEERKLAGFLVRKTTPVFPLKVGILLYKDAGALPEGDRKLLFNNFVEKLKTNPNIGQIVQISQNLITSGSSIDDIRKLGARFQVSSVLVISESYPFPTENAEAVVTPIDSITGTRTWDEFSKIEVYSIDILNGVFIFSTSSGVKETQKYNRTSSTIKNPDTLLVRSTAEKAWKGLEDKVMKEINNYRSRVDSNTVVPIIAQTPLPLPS